MSEWKESKLENLGVLQRGRSRHRPRYAFHLYGGKYPFIQTGEIRTARKYIRDYEQTYSEAGLAQSKLWSKNTLCITIAANIAELAILSFDACFPDSVLGFIPQEDKADLDFIYYTLTHFQRELKHIGEGSVQDNINLGTFQDVLFPIPPLTEQKAIAAVLSSLDNKIDLLHRKNLTLEAMAETLFRQWFIEEAQEDWEEKSLLDLVDLVGGGTPKTSINEYWNGDIPWLSGGDIATNHKGFVTASEKTISKAGLDNSSAKLLPKFATVISARGTVGKYCLLAGDMTFSQSNYGILPKIKGCYFFAYLLVNHVVEELQSAAYGSVFDTITTSTFRDATFTTPPLDKILDFESVIAKYFDKKLLNQIQIRTLEKLRDTLLPKLMSGEIRIKLDEPRATP
jgi:type I restriction enzyme S subunit